MDENKSNDSQELTEEVKVEETQEVNDKIAPTKKIFEFLTKFTTKQKVVGAVAILVLYTLMVGIISANIQRQILANQIQKSFEQAFFTGSDSVEEKQPTKTNKKETKEKQQDIKNISLDEIVTTENYEFTLNNVELSYEVKPDNPPSYYTYYTAPDGKVYIYVNASVKNLSKKSVGCDEIYSVTADYNEGYEYNGFNIANDSNGDFTYANITNIDPLETLGVHCLIECPEEIEINTDKPLFITITLKDGSKYKYQIR